MDIRLIVMDMDGTLLNSDQCIPEDNLNALLEAQKKGIRLVLASGRSYKTLTEYGLQLKMPEYDGYFIGVNGAALTKTATMEHEIIRQLQHDEIKEIYEAAMPYEIEVMGVMDATIANATEYTMLQRGQSWASVEQRESGSKIFTGVLKDGKHNTDNKTYSTIAYNPRTATSYTGNGAMGDWVQDGIHYIRCQEIRLNYTVPSSFLEKSTKGLISRASVYVAGNDLFTITNYSGVNPVGNSMSAAAGGSGGMGIDNWGLPSPRSVQCGLSVTF